MGVLSKIYDEVVATTRPRTAEREAKSRAMVMGAMIAAQELLGMNAEETKRLNIAGVMFVGPRGFDGLEECANRERWKAAQEK